MHPLKIDKIRSRASVQVAALAPIVSDRDCFLHTFVVHDIHDVLCKPAPHVHLRIRRLVRASVPKHVWNDQAVPTRLEEYGFLGPVPRRRWESMQEDER